MSNVYELSRNWIRMRGLEMEGRKWRFCRQVLCQEGVEAFVTANAMSYICIVKNEKQYFCTLCSSYQRREMTCFAIGGLQQISTGTHTTLLQCIISGGRTKGATKLEIFCFRPPTWRLWRNVKTNYEAATVTASKTSLENIQLGNGDYFVICASSILYCWQSSLQMDW